MIICQQTVVLTGSDIIHSQLEKFLHFSSKFQDTLLAAVNLTNHIEINKSQVFLNHKIHQLPKFKRLPNPCKLISGVDVVNLASRSMTNVNITIAAQRAAQLEAQLTRTPFT
jgi:hypothetical protein